MSLEENLKRQVAQRAAEQLRQKKEQELAAAAAEKAQAEQAEQARLGDLRSNITHIDAKIGQIQALLGELREAHTQATDSAAGAKKERLELTQATTEIEKLFGNPELQALLAEQGIHSLDDLLKAGDYQNNDEVQKVKALRESAPKKREAARSKIVGRGVLKKKAAGIIKENQSQSRLTYEDIVGALRELLEDMGQERQKLFDQTPEGLEARKEKVREGIIRRHRDRNTSYLLTEKDNLERQNQLVERDDILVAKENGEDVVKTALVEYYSSRVDSEMNRKKDNKGLNILSADLDRLQNALSSDSKIRDAVSDAERARAELVSHFVEVCRNKPENLEKLNRYYRTSFEPNELEDAAERHVSHIEELAATARGFDLKAMRESLRVKDSGRRNLLFPTTVRNSLGDDIDTNVLNPDYFLDKSKTAIEYFNALAAKNELALPREDQFMQFEAQVPADKDWRVGKVFVYVNKKTEPFIYQHGQEASRSLDAAIAEVKKEVAVFDAAGQKVKDKLPAKVEAD